MVNCAVAVSLKSGIHAFGKFYYESAVLLYNDQNVNCEPELRAYGEDDFVVSGINQETTKRSDI